MPTLMYQLDGTAITFKNTGGTALFTPTSLGTLAAHQSALADLGATARAERFAWRAYCQFSTQPIVGEVVNVFIKTSDGTHADNDDADADAAVSALDKLKNLQFIGAIIVDEALVDKEFVASGEIWLPHRYLGVAFENKTVDTLSTDATEQGVIFTPVPMQSQ